MQKLQYFCGKQQFRLQLLGSDKPAVYAEKVPSNLVNTQKVLSENDPIDLEDIYILQHVIGKRYIGSKNDFDI